MNQQCDETARRTGSDRINESTVAEDRRLDFSRSKNRDGPSPYKIPSIILARTPEVTERQRHGSLVRECRTVQRDTAGRILSSVTVSVSDQNRVSRGTVFSFAIVGRVLFY